MEEPGMFLVGVGVTMIIAGFLKMLAAGEDAAEAIEHQYKNLRNEQERNAADLHIRLDRDHHLQVDGHEATHRMLVLVAQAVDGLTPPAPFHTPAGYHCGGS